MVHLLLRPPACRFVVQLHSPENFARSATTSVHHLISAATISAAMASAATLRYYSLAISLVALLELVTAASSTSTVYGRRKEGFQQQQGQKTVGSTIHFGQSGDGLDSHSADTDDTRFSAPADEAAAADDDEISPSSYHRYQRNLDRFLRPSSPPVSSTVYGHRAPEVNDGSEEDSSSMQWAPSTAQVATFARGSTEEDSFMVQSTPSRGGALWGGSSSSSKRPGSVARPSGRITFGPSSSSISVGSSYSIGGGRGRGVSSLRRSKRSPQMYGYQQQQPQQHQQQYYHRRSYPPPPPYSYSGGYGNQLDFSLVPSSNQQQQYNGGYGGYKEDPDDNCYYHTLVNGDSEMLFRLLLPIRLRGRTIVKKCIQPTPNVNDPRYKVLLRGSNQGSYGHLNANIKL